MIRKVFKFLWNENKFFISFIVVYTIVSGILPSCSLFVMQELINQLQMPHLIVDKIIFFLSLYIIIDFIIILLDIVKGYYEQKFKLENSMYINILFLEKMVEIPYDNFENSDIYDEIQKAKGQFNNVYRYFQTILSVYKALLTIISSFCIISSWRLWTILVIIFMAILNSAILYKIGEKKYRIYQERVNEERKREYYKFLLSNDFSMKEIKAYNVEKFFMTEYQNISQKFIKQDKKLLIKTTRIQTLISIVDQLLMTFFFICVIYDTFTFTIKIGNTISYMKSLSTIRNNTKSIFNIFVNLHQEKLYLNDFFKIFEIDLAEKKQKGDLLIDEINKIEVKNLSFKYPKSRMYTIRNINFVVNKGEQTIIVGENGSGKTTIFKLLLGFYNEYEGEILINDIELSYLNIKRLREKMGVLFQDFNRYELTLNENIVLGESCYEKNVNSNIDYFFYSKRPVDLEQQLGNWFIGGKQLSGGEWAKVGICRAFVRNRDVLLLDEANAFLDTKTEKRLINRLKQEKEKQIQLIISHRYGNIIQQSDNIIVLNKGEIAAHGKHNDLVNNSDIYRKLYFREN